MTENEITYLIRKSIFEVYNHLGPGLLESVYEKTLALELQEMGWILSFRFQFLLFIRRRVWI